MKRWIFVFFVLAVLFGGIYLRLVNNKAAKATQAQQRVSRMKAPPPVRTAVAQVEDVTQSYDGVGTVEAPLDVKVSSKVTGRILSISKEPGDAVTAGEVLAQIDPSDLRAQMQQQQANLDQARYKLAQGVSGTSPNDVQILTVIAQDQAALASAEANQSQVQQNASQLVAAADAAVVDAQAKVDSASSTITNSTAQIRSAQANLANAQSQYNRTHTLFVQGYQAAQDVDTAMTAVKVQQGALDVAQAVLASSNSGYQSAVAERDAAHRQADVVKTQQKASIISAAAQAHQAAAALQFASANRSQKLAYEQSLEALKAAVAATQAQLRDSQVLLAETVIRAPISGFVTDRSMDPGMVATEGTPILSVRYIRDVWVTVPVPEDQSRHIQVGQLANVAFDSIPGKTFTGKVTQVPPSGDPTTREFPITVTLDNSQGLIKPGMFGRVHFITANSGAKVVVPPEAIQHDKNGAFVTVVDEANVAHRHPVTLGLSDPSGVVVLSGVQPLDRVVVLSTLAVKDGQKVRLPTGGGAPQPASSTPPAGA